MRLFALVLLCAAAARADQANDLQLWRLGHPDDVVDPATNAKEPGSMDAQMRFHMLASTLGLAFIPPFQETAGTLGQAGFEVGFSSQQAFLRIPNEAWATQAASAPGVLVIPTVVARKGLGGSLELGAAVSWLTQSQMMALSAELRWALLDGIAYAPDFALRAYGTRVIGTRELDLTSAGADASLSKSFGLAGMVKLQPYAQLGVALVNAASTVVDFKPAAENDLNPTEDDGTFRTVSMLKNRYLRGVVGVRLVAGVVVLGVEASLASGKNPVQDDAGGPSQTVHLATLSGRLGFTF